VIWIPVTESLPDLDTPVLLTDGSSIITGQLEKAYFGERTEWVAIGVSGYEWEWLFDGEYGKGLVTHWMPLPPLPQSQTSCTAGIT
jgi:hypothetical protein